MDVEKIVRLIDRRDSGPVGLRSHEMNYIDPKALGTAIGLRDRRKLSTDPRCRAP
jgi:hypothetical protein